jgi:hypothetical protein
MLLIGCYNTSDSNDIEISAVVVASEFLVGNNRVPFRLIKKDGEPLTNPSRLELKLYKLEPNSNDIFKGTTEAIFTEVTGSTSHKHEDDSVHLHNETTGIYIAKQVYFDVVGIWEIHIYTTEGKNNNSILSSMALNVIPESKTIEINDLIPKSLNPTSQNIENLSEITTHTPAVPGLYKITVAQALIEQKPIVVAFATPSFCNSRMCGPVTDVVAQTYTTYSDTVNFIHIEPWDLNIARNTGKLQPTPITLEWNLPSEPWVFVVDKTGRVTKRFEGLFGKAELSEAIEEVLSSK